MTPQHRAHPAQRPADPSFHDAALGRSRVGSLRLRVAPTRLLSRRSLLRGAGVGLALPLLDAMQPRSAAAAGDPASDPPMRMLCICTNMGMMPQLFWPQGTGKDYRPSRYLQLIDQYRDHFTVFSGLSHPDVDGGHHAEVSFLTAAPHPASGGFRNTISVDQYAAERIGFQTRFPSLVLNVGNEGTSGLSWTASGVAVPGESKPSELFKRLFVQGNRAEVTAQVRRLQDGRSVLDAVADRARGLQRRVGADDRQKLEQYFSSVRELEQRLVKAEQWEHQPKPQPDVQPPQDIDDRGALIQRSRLMFRMARLALQTDSTRIITLRIDQNSNPKVNLGGVTQGHHSLTHHGNRSESVQQLEIIEAAQTSVFSELLGDLLGVGEQGKTLLDRTMVLYGSNLGNANSHDNRNLPILLAGGGFRHGQHLAFDRQNNDPLPNLFVSMLQQIGLETDRFASSTGTIRGLQSV